MAIEKCLIQYVPVDNISDCYNYSPQNNSELCKSLFETVANKKDYWLFSFKVLGRINRLRLKHGRPPLEPRHPNIKSGKPWPILNLLS